MTRTLLAVSFLLAASACFAQRTEWRQTVSIDGRIADTQRVAVEASSGVTAIRVHDASDRLLRQIELGDGFVPIRSFLYASDGSLEVGLEVTDGRAVAARTTRGVRTHTSRGPFLFSDESLYLVLSQWLANGFLAADRTADLYEARSGRFTPMRFRLVARGDVEIGDRCVGAVRVEMSLADPVGRLFWPHAYSYWFAADDGRFLAYEGRDQDGRVIRLERV
jgi:hypothetical protein